MVVRVRPGSPVIKEKPHRRLTLLWGFSFITDPERGRGPSRGATMWYTILMWYLYILRCNDEMLYTGITTDVTKRVDRHNKKKASRYTRMRLPVELIYREEHPNKFTARKREIQIKNWSRAKKLALIAKAQ